MFQSWILVTLLSKFQQQSGCILLHSCDASAFLSECQQLFNRPNKYPASLHIDRTRCSIRIYSYLFMHTLTEMWWVWHVCGTYHLHTCTLIAHTSDTYATRVLHFRISRARVGQVQKESNIKAVLWVPHECTVIAVCTRAALTVCTRTAPIFCLCVAYMHGMCAAHMSHVCMTCVMLLSHTYPSWFSTRAACM